MILSKSVNNVSIQSLNHLDAYIFTFYKDFNLPNTSCQHISIYIKGGKSTLHCLHTSQPQTNRRYIFWITNEHILTLSSITYIHAMIWFRHFSATSSSTINFLGIILFLGFCLVGQITDACGDDIQPTLDSVRSSLIRQEDTIIFALIERANFPINSPLYNHTSTRFPGTLFEYFVKRTEAIQSKVMFYLLESSYTTCLVHENCNFILM